MREIKFRAWFDGEMHSHEDLVDMDQETHAVYTILTHKEQVNGDAFMQYTGLKDKNRREIYEGDIITIPAWRNAQFKVVFEAGMFRAVEGERKISMATFKGEVRCEVIGNIFENSELLEAEK